MRNSTKTPLISELFKTLENIHVLEKNCYEHPEASVTSLRINSDCEENISATTLASTCMMHPQGAKTIGEIFGMTFEVFRMM